MFKNIKLNTKYNTIKNNVTEEFYIPILSKAVRYDRTTGYFSSKVLSTYSKGLEKFAKKGNKFRLIVSIEGINYEDFELIKKGYFLKSNIGKKLFDSLDDYIDLEDEKNLSNLAYLIYLGIVEIKFSF